MSEQVLSGGLKTTATTMWKHWICSKIHGETPISPNTMLCIM